METITVIMFASSIKEAKGLAFESYGSAAKYVKPYKYVTKGNNFYEFLITTPSLT